MGKKINNLILKRRSPLAFSDKPVEKEKLRLLFEAARWAASSFNEQPWRFIFAVKENKQEFSKFLSCLAEGNRVWAQNAPVLAITVAKKDFTHTGTKNKHAWHDLGLAMGNLSLQAADLDIYIHQMAGFDANKAVQFFDIPMGYQPVAMVAIGYPGNIERLPAALKNREQSPRKRRDLEDLVFINSWGNQSF